MNKKILLPILLAVFLIAIIVIGRLIPHLPNFTPVAAVALFAGYIFRSKILAFSVPIAGMLLTDFLFEGLYNSQVMLFVYVGIVLAVLISSMMKANIRMRFLPPKIEKYLSYTFKLSMTALTASMSFFVISNFAVWLFSGMYLWNLAGLIQCYVLAIPFFHYALLGDLFYAAILFGGYELIRAIQRDGLSVRAFGFSH